jgi:hypothetical protein
MLVWQPLGVEGAGADDRWQSIQKLTAIVAALDSDAAKAAVCRAFGVKRSTLIDSLARIGWPSGTTVHGDRGDETLAIDGGSTRRAV